MSIRRSMCLVTMALVLMLAGALTSLAQEPGQPPYELERPGVLVARPRVGIASPTIGNADNLMIAGGTTAEAPLVRVLAGHRIHLRSDYEAVLFPSGVGSAKFELEVHRLLSNGNRELLGSDQAIIWGTGPKRVADALNVRFVLTQPGVYRLAIVSRSTADPVGAPAVFDEDEIIVYVIVTGTTPTIAPSDPTAMPTATPEAVAALADRWGRISRPVLESRPQPVALAMSEDAAQEMPQAPMTSAPVTPVPVPTDRSLLVASPRGHFLRPSIGAVENFDQNHGQVLVVAEGSTVTFKSAYEFVWFAGTSGIAQTELGIYLNTIREGEPPLAEDGDETNNEGNAWRISGVLEAEVPFDEAGRYEVIARIYSRVEPSGGNPEAVFEDEDFVRVRVWVVGQPEVGSISGTVTAADNEIPIEKVAIRVVDAETGRVVRTVFTLADGTYQATNLAPGKYLVQADPRSQNYLPEWYDDAPTRDQADPVEVLAGETTPDIDFGLTPGGVISGLVIEDDPDATSPDEKPLGNVLVVVGRFEDNKVVATTRTLRDGSYHLDKLHANTYWVYAGNTNWATREVGMTPLIGEYWDDHLLREDADCVLVSEGQHVKGIDFALRYGGAIAGRVVGGVVSPVLAPFKVTVYDWDTWEEVCTVSTRRDGSYYVPSLLEGRYGVYAFDEGGYYTPEYYDDVTDPSEATPVSVRRGKVTGPIDFRLQMGTRSTLKIEPLVTQIQPGDAFSVTVEVKDVVDLGAFSFELTYDAEVIEATGVALGQFLGSTGRSVLEVGPVMTPGRISYGAVSFGDEPGPSGAGVLATIGFQALAPGSTLLELEDTVLTDTKGHEQEHVVRGGRVVVAECIFGDFDCDCDVDIVDVMAVASRWGSVEGDSLYDPLYDVDDDGDIDIVDVALVAAAWGNTCENEIVAPQEMALATMGAPHMLTTGLRIEPAQAEAKVGQPVILSVWIDEANDLGGFEFTLAYDADKLSISAEDIALGDFVESSGRSATLIGPLIEVDGSQGSVSLGAMTLGAYPSGPDGSGVLAQLTFLPVAAGEADVDLTSAQVTNTQGQAQEQLALQGGTITIGASAANYIPFVRKP